MVLSAGVSVKMLRLFFLPKSFSKGRTYSHLEAIIKNN